MVRHATDSEESRGRSWAVRRGTMGSGRWTARAAQRGASESSDSRKFARSFTATTRATCRVAVELRSVRYDSPPVAWIDALLLLWCFWCVRFDVSCRESMIGPRLACPLAVKALRENIGNEQKKSHLRIAAAHLTLRVCHFRLYIVFCFGPEA